VVFVAIAGSWKTFSEFEILDLKFENPDGSGRGGEDYTAIGGKAGLTEAPRGVAATERRPSRHKNVRALQTL